jgi:hypothetical protein
VLKNLYVDSPRVEALPSVHVHVAVEVVIVVIIVVIVVGVGIGVEVVICNYIHRDIEHD